MRRSTALLAFASVLATAPAAAKQPRETMCNFVVQLPEGGYTFRPNYGFSVIREVQRSGSAFTVKSDEKVVGFACLRSSLIPVPEDLIVLRSGYSITIAEEEQGGGMIYLELANGEINAKSNGAGFTEKERQTFETTISKMQAELETAEPKP